MNNSYNDGIRQRFPMVAMPLKESQLYQFEAASRIPAEKRYIYKSERLAVLEEELQIANRLRDKLKEVETAWNVKCYGAPNLSNLSYMEEDPNGAADVIQELVCGFHRTYGAYEARYTAALKAVQAVAEEHYQRICMEREIEQKGVSGEAQVGTFLSRQLGCQMLTNLILPAVQDHANAPKTAETDLLLISQRGIYVCEIKNYGKAGQILKLQPNGEIEKCSADGRVLETLPSPFAQNEHHCKAVRSVLAKAGLSYIPVYPAVIIANPDVSIQNRHGFQIGNMYAFRDFVFKTSGDTFTEQQMASVVGALLQHKLDDRKFPILSIRPIYDAVMSVLPTIMCAAKNKNANQIVAKEWVYSWICGEVEMWNKRNRGYVKYRKFQAYILRIIPISVFLLLAAAFIAALVDWDYCTTAAAAAGSLFYALYIGTSVMLIFGGLLTKRGFARRKRNDLMQIGRTSFACRKFLLCMAYLVTALAPAVWMLLIL